jgi:ParB family chromosome partitioning protein
MPQRLSGLGRGLSSLIPQKSPTASASVATAESVAEGDIENRILHVPPSDIVPNPEQPRSVFHHQELEDLMNSIQEHGILQPLVVTRGTGGGYELIAGERRYRAAKMLGLATVPVIVREAERNDKLLLALIENIQREDLNPLEEARSYARLVSEFNLTQEEVAKQVGKARPTVANCLRLLELPQEMQDAISEGTLSAGTARAVLALKDEKSRLAFFRKFMRDRISTREAEEGVRRMRAGTMGKEPALRAAEEELREILKARVEIKKRGGESGTISVSFYSDEEFEALVARLREIPSL